MKSAGEYKVTTDFDNGLIRQTVSYDGRAFVQMVLDVRERQIREALIAMGWTPPGPDIAGASPDATRDTSPSAGGDTET